jgi:predicted unusual protein kinase regulating ubiquinone biosynthesis (AarF/ABC1/UbiB family)
MIVPGTDPVRLRGLADRLLAIAYEPSSMQERIELVANEVMAELYDWPVQLPSELVYFARTTTLIEGLGVRYDANFNPIQFATPIALRMRHDIMRSLGQTPGQPSPVDMATLVGAVLGRAARVVVNTGEEWMNRLMAGLRGLTGAFEEPNREGHTNGALPAPKTNGAHRLLPAPPKSPE